MVRNARTEIGRLGVDSSVGNLEETYMAATVTNAYMEVSCALRNMGIWIRKEGKDALWLLPYRNQVPGGSLFVGNANLDNLRCVHLAFSEALGFKPFGFAQNKDEEYGDSIVVLIPAAKKAKLQQTSPCNIMENLKKYFTAKQVESKIEGLDDDDEETPVVEGQ